MSREQLQEKPPTILLVEDNPAHATLVIRCLEEHPIINKVYHVANGETALDYLFRRGDYQHPEKSPRPNVILLDLRLPDMDGLEVMREIKSSGDLETIPFVVLSSSDSPADVEAAYRQQANSFLVKPSDFENFQKLMTALGFYWLDWNQYPSSDEKS